VITCVATEIAALSQAPVHNLHSQFGWCCYCCFCTNTDHSRAPSARAITDAGYGGGYGGGPQGGYGGGK
jgi:uncharacterized membrane protein